MFSPQIGTSQDGPPTFECESLRANGWHEFDASRADVLKMADLFLTNGWVIDHIVLIRPGTRDRANAYVWRHSPRITTCDETALQLLRRFTKRAFPNNWRELLRGGR